MRQFDSMPLRNRTEQLLVAVVALSLLSMPVSYRGGAEASHPHVFIQLWIDAAHNSFNHHHHPGDDANIVPVNASDHPHSESNQQAPVLDRAEADVPRISAFTTPEVRSLAMVAGLLLLLRLGITGKPVFADRRVLRGRTTDPELPPPKALLAAV